MEWSDWIGKKVFIKLLDGSCFSESLVKDADDKFISITDKFGDAVSVSTSQIIKIVEDGE